jgi:5-methylcytosine-specific restriction endonuclease McrA
MRRLQTFVVVALLPFLSGMAEARGRLDVRQETAGIVGLMELPLLEEPPSASMLEVIAGKRPGSRFTQKDKAAVKQDNAARNEGKNKCENCGVETVPPQQHKKGVTPPKNETQVDHVLPKAKGGTGDPGNGQVLCRDCNIKKSDKQQ